MKQLVIIVMTVFLFAACKMDNDDPPNPEPQPNYFTFTGYIGTNDNSTTVSVDNNLIICGNTGDKVTILKISKTGTQIWRSDFGAGNNSSASGVTELNEDIFICGSTSRNYSTTKHDILLIKANSAGDTIWTKTFGGSEAEYGTNIIATSDGNILIAGRTESFGAGSLGDIFLVKVNSSGDTLWTASYPDQDQEVPFHLMETKNGEYLVTGTNEDNGQYRELYLLKISATGQQLWNKKIGPPTWKWGYSTIELINGDLLTCGKHAATGYNQVLVVKTDNAGNVIWEKEYGTNNLSEEGKSIKQNSDGTFTITGTCFDISTGQTDIILLKIDQRGNQLWFKKFGSTSGGGVNLIKDSNDDNIITGNCNGSIFMTRTDNNGVFK